MKFDLRSLGLWALGALVALAGATASAQAPGSHWNGSTSSSWNNAANWSAGGGASPGGVPVGGADINDAHINTNVASEVFVAEISDELEGDDATPRDIKVGFGAGAAGLLNHASGRANLGGGSGNGWTFAGAAGGSGVYNLSGTADLNTGNFIAGDGGGSVGEINVSGNALVHANNEIWVGNGGNANGTLNINSGTVEAATWIAVGRDSGTGVLNLSGTGVMKKLVTGPGNSANSFFTIGGLGTGAGGTVNISDNAVLDLATNMIIAETGGRSGVVNQTGGTVTVRNNTSNVDGFSDSLYTQFAATGTGTYNLSGGLLDAQTINNLQGTFNMTGGTLHAEAYKGNLAQNGGTLSPGHSPGTMLITGNYSLLSGDLNMEIEGTTAGTSYDQLIVTGDVSLAGALTLAGSYAPLPGNSFTLIDNQGANAVSGIFTGLSEGATVSFNSVNLKITYLGGTGNDVVLFAVPEPSAVALLALGAAGLGIRRRR